MLSLTRGDKRCIQTPSSSTRARPSRSPTFADRLFTEITVGGGQGLKKQFSDPEKYKAKYLEVYAECLRVVKNPEAAKVHTTIPPARKQLETAA